MSKVIHLIHSMPNVLTPADLKLREYIEKKASNGKSLKKMQEILNKTDISLTQLVIEERERHRW